MNPDTLDRLLQTCALIGEGCFVALLGDDGQSLHPAAVHFRDEAAHRAARPFLTAGAIPEAAGRAQAWIARPAPPLALGPAEIDRLSSELPAPHAALIRGLAISNLLAVPLHLDGRALGLVALARTGAGAPAFSDVEQALARNLVEHATLSISNAQLRESLERQVAERRRAEEIASRFVGLIEASGELIAMAGLDGAILFVNEGGRRLLGIDPDVDLRALRLADFHTEDGMRRAAILRETGRWQGRGQLRHFKTGELIDTQVSSFLVRDANGQAVAYATVQHDMRDTKRLEAQIRQAQKMEAIGTLAGGIAHDFNNILTAILGNLELARLDLGPRHPAHERLDEIAAAGRRAADLVRQILTVGRQREASKRVLRLGEVIEEAVALLRSTIPAGVELSTTIAADTPAVLADPTQIHQVLLNLCTNAWQALPGGTGRIAVTGQSAASPRADGDRAARWARLEVTDNGLGMTDEVAQRIFDPFFTTKPAGEGTGLGLSVVHGIVIEHGGVIRVKSSPGAGSTFEILLPGVQPTAERAPPRTPAAPAATRPRRVLYLDDEPALVRTIQAMLKNLGHQAMGHSDPEQALAHFRRAPDAFDVVITDHNMPGLSGIEVAKLMTALRPDLPVILTSGHIPEPLREQAARAGVTTILEKPTTLEDLSRAIETVTGGPTDR